MICNECGKDHPIEESELSFRRPDDTAEMTEEDRDKTVQEDRDLASIRGERFFVRAVLPLPFNNHAGEYNIGLWVEVQKATFRRVLDLWSEPEQASEPAFTASVANEIPSLPTTYGLAAEMHLTGPTSRPRVMLLPSEHVLFEEQQNGISLHRANEYTSFVAQPGA